MTSKRPRPAQKPMPHARIVAPEKPVAGYRKVSDEEAKIREAMKEYEAITDGLERDLLAIENQKASLKKKAQDACAALLTKLGPRAERLAEFMETNREALTTARRKASHELPTGDIVKWTESDAIDIPKPTAFVKEAIDKKLQKTLLRLVFAPEVSEKIRKHLDDLKKMTTGRHRRERKVQITFAGIKDRLEVVTDLETGAVSVVVPDRKPAE